MRHFLAALAALIFAVAVTLSLPGPASARDADYHARHHSDWQSCNSTVANNYHATGRYYDGGSCYP